MAVKNGKEIKVKINGKEVNCFIEKRKRKTIAIRVKEGESISVVCPFKVPYEYIEKVIKDKSEWIEKTFIKIQESAAEKKSIENSVKEKYLFFGNEYEVKILSENRAVLYEMDDGKIIIYSKGKAEKIIVKKWYRSCAEEILNKRIRYYANIIGKIPKEIKIKQLRGSWGICSSNGTVTFNWKLIMAPIDVIDYVVIHELCHLIHHNHSKQFWEEVVKYMVDYKEKKSWLKENGIKIEVIAKRIE